MKIKWLTPKPRRGGGLDDLGSRCFSDDHPKLSIALIVGFIVLAILGAPR